MGQHREGSQAYLYKHFRIDHYSLDSFPGPKAGEPAEDFTALDFEGNEHRLSDLRGKWAAIEVGSATCTQYTKNIRDMDTLRHEFPDVEFLLVYVREAHPGERLPQHRSFDEKMRAAKLLPRRYGENRRILVDSLEGGMHRRYGSMPNFVYIVRPDGIVHYRCNWATTGGIRKALAERDRLHTDENADMKELMKGGMFSWNRFRTMWTGGVMAFVDFLITLPKLLKRHRQVDRYYREHGQFRDGG